MAKFSKLKENLQKYLYLWVTERTIPAPFIKIFKPYRQPIVDVNVGDKKFERGVLCISIDYEMGFGMRPFVKSYARLSRNNFAPLLDLLDKYDVPTTWGVVGKIYEDVEDKTKQDDYLLGERNYIQRLKKRRTKHEIATHTYDHIDFSKAEKEQVEAQLAKMIGHKTLIFPKNHVAHLDKILKYGIWIYRGAEHAIQYPIKKYGLWNITQTYELSGRAHEKRILPRAKTFIDTAISTGLVCHLWFHVFEMDSKMLANTLEPLLQYATKLRGEGKLNIMTMEEIAKVCKGKR